MVALLMVDRKQVYPFTSKNQASTEVGMRKPARVASWAVYQVTIQGQPGPNVVCPQHEWDAIEKSTPGLHRLIRGGIANEGEAERLARGTSGDDPVRLRKLPTATPPEPDHIVEPRGEPGAPVGQDDAAPLLLPFPIKGANAADKSPDGEVAYLTPFNGVVERPGERGMQVWR
jgi:hypothetical protein